ncbi:MAG: cytochrome-c peroxidase [Chitinophagales bacterium]
MKTFSVILFVAISVSIFSFNEREDPSYKRLYTINLDEFKQEQAILENAIIGSGLQSEKDMQEIRQRIAAARLKLKNLDIWLRYFEPNAYRMINGPLPVEWETEVFEKFEPPHRREGAGLTVAELYMDEKGFVKDTLIALIKKSRAAIKTFEADSITSQLNTFSHFFLANRLFLLNLAAIYTTGFECPDKSHVIPELLSMLEGTENIYNHFNQSFPTTPLEKEYLALYEKMILFVKGQPVEFSHFDHFRFIRDYVNPLFAINQHYINVYNVRSINNNDYTLNNLNNSIFDKSLYTPQSAKGIYTLIDDPKTLNEISYIGKLLFYDPILSGNNLRSCASCHKPTQYFTDTTLITPLQFDKEHHLPRNAPTLINVVYNHLIMLDGKHFSLIAQGKDVMTNPIEMNGTEKEIIRKLMTCKEYKDALKKFSKLTPEEKEIGLSHVVSAISFYYGSYSRFKAPFDDAINGKATVTQEVQNGFNLFMSKAKCATCHFVPNFNGVKPPYLGSEFEVIGAPQDTTFKEISEDKGRWLINPAPETMHAFRTGSIRNASYTKPYMHNGVFKSLDEVIDFYDAGGGTGKKMSVDNQTLEGDSLKLSPKEKKELLSFLEALNEEIIFEEAPASLPTSSEKSLNKRKVGGLY